MSFNIVTLTNDGITSVFSKMDFALLKARPLADDNGEVRAYRATLVITTDRSTYTRSNGERVEGANTGEVFQVTINSNKVPEIKAMVMGIKLVKPQVHAVYATSSQDSTFATINVSISAEDMILPEFNKGGRNNG